MNPFKRHVVAFLVLSGHSVFPAGIFHSSFSLFSGPAFVSEPVCIAYLLSARHILITRMAVWRGEAVGVLSSADILRTEDREGKEIPPGPKATLILIRTQTSLTLRPGHFPADEFPLTGAGVSNFDPQESQGQDALWDSCTSHFSK